MKFLDITPTDWDRIQDVNLKGVLFLSQAVVPHMKQRKSGSIACMSSVSAQRGGGIFGGPHYSAAKAGVLGLAKAMARELGPARHPRQLRDARPDRDRHHARQADRRNEDEDHLKGIPLGRLGNADDVAGIFTFLASDLSATSPAR